MQTANTPLAQPKKLLGQVRDRIRVKHFSIRTETQTVQPAQLGLPSPTSP